MDQVEDVTEGALRYLGAKDDERLSPDLASFLAAAVERLDRQRGPAGAELKWNSHAVTPKDLGLLIESWLVVHRKEQPLWPKDYEPPRGVWMPFTGRGGDPDPEWMRRRWV